jgi:hypothetical protein
MSDRRQREPKQAVQPQRSLDLRILVRSRVIERLLAQLQFRDRAALHGQRQRRFPRAEVQEGRLGARSWQAWRWRPSGCGARSPLGPKCRKLSRPPLPTTIHAMLPPARMGAGQRPPLRRQLDALMAEPLAVAPRLLVHVGLGLRRLAPLTQGMQVALAVQAAVDDGLDVIAGPGIAGTKRAAGTELVTPPALFGRVAL